MSGPESTSESSGAAATPPRASVAFLFGAFLPLKGAKFLLGRPRLLAVAAIPILINALLFVLILTWGFSATRGWASQLSAGHEGWLWGALSGLLQTLYWVLALIVAYFLFTPVALIVSAPFNDWLAEQAERACGLAMPEDNRPLVRRLFGEILYVMGSECKRMAWCSFVFLLLFALGLIPVLNVIAAILSALWACHCSAYEFMSYPADRRHLNWKQKRELFRRSRGLSYGFGAATALLLLVPFVNVFMVTSGAIAGAFYYASLERGR